MSGPHLLAPPFGLHPADEARLLGLLEDADWAAVVTLLRNAIVEGSPPRWLVLLAFARFQDVSEVMLDEQLVGCRESLQLLERAVELGVPMGAVAPLREEIEQTLSSATTAELKLLAQVEGPLERVPTDVLADAAFVLWSSQPARAAELFEALAQRLSAERPLLAGVARLRAGLCWSEAGQHARAESMLAEVEKLPWADRALRSDRQVAEMVWATRLLAAEGVQFEASWAAAQATGEVMGLPFPSVWPNQEKLLARCIAIGDWRHAVQVADAIEAGREVLPTALVELIKLARRGPGKA